MAVEGGGNLHKGWLSRQLIMGKYKLGRDRVRTTMLKVLKSVISVKGDFDQRIRYKFHDGWRVCFRQDEGCGQMMLKQ